MAFTFGASACTIENSEPGDAAFREVVEQLPSGADVSVEITTPAHGDVFAPGPVAVTGFATIGEADAIAQSNLVLLLDVSGSTDNPGACGGDLNADGDVDTVLDCEIAAALEVNARALQAGTIAKVGVGAFGTFGVAADVDPFGSDADPLTELDADHDNDGVADIEQVLRSIQYGDIELFTPGHPSLKTSYGAGLQGMVPVLAADEQANNILLMISDGGNNTEPAVADVLPAIPANTTIYTFAIGAKANCDGGNTFGSLRDISNATGGTCTEVPDVADLPLVLPQVIAVEMSGLVLRVDGELVAIDDVDQVPPLEGPATLAYSTMLNDLAPGQHELCATASGVDGIGSADATECCTITINSEPVAVCEDIVVAADQTCTANPVIGGDDLDPDGDAVTCYVDPPGPYPIGETQVTKTCSDPSGALSSCEATIVVVDESPPELVANDDLKLWPPDHKTHTFTAEDCFSAITSGCGGEGESPLDGASFEIMSVTSDESDNDLGDGNTCADTIMIVDPLTFTVRSERTGLSDGRMYTATFRVTDALGNQSYADCHVTVPQAHNKKAKDSGCAVCLDNDGGQTCAAIDGDGCPTVAEVCQ